jgi:hypothetical protein
MHSRRSSDRIWAHRYALEEYARVLERAKGLVLLIGKGGFYGNVLRIKPPMLISFPRYWISYLANYGPSLHPLAFGGVLLVDTHGLTPGVLYQFLIGRLCYSVAIDDQHGKSTNGTDFL